MGPSSLSVKIKKMSKFVISFFKDMVPIVRKSLNVIYLTL